MSARSEGTRAGWSLLPLARFIALLSILLPPMARGETQSLLLDVQINEHPIGKIGEFTLRDGVLLATRIELSELGIRGPLGLMSRHANGGNAEPESLVSLSDLLGLRWRIDQQTQTIYISATDERLLPKVLEENSDKGTQDNADPVIESGTGITLNYDVAATVQGRQAGSSSLLDLRAFSRWGILSSGTLAYAGAGNGSADALSSPNKSVRLDTLYTFADVGAMRRYSIGDVITGGLSWTRPFRLSGIQLRSDFSLRPDLVTFPLPSFVGTAAVPSTVDVLANGNLVSSHQVDAGPFEIPQLPVVNGANTVSVTVTNALGQQVSVTQPVYASTSLLAPGLQTYSAQVGPVRRQWGQISNAYGKVAAVGDYRRGVTRRVTVEASTEGTPGAILVGGGAVVGVGSLGVLNASATASSSTVAGSSDGGTRLSFGAQRVGTVWSFGVSEILSSPHFRDVAALNGDTVERRVLSATSGLAFHRWGTFGLSYAATRQDRSPHPLAEAIFFRQHGEVLAASYSRQISRMSIYVNEFKDLANAGDNGLRAGVIFALGQRQSAAFSAGSGEGYGEVRVQKSAAQIGERGYNAYVSAGRGAHVFAQAEYRSSRGLLTAGMDQQGGTSTLRAESQGAISWIDRALFASNSIYDSFAVVDTHGLAHVRVLAENREVGATDAKGRLLVPDLRAFQLNHLAINASDVPMDTTLDSEVRTVKPQDRSGLVVRFPVRVSHAALLRLVDNAGIPLSVGSKATLRSTRTAFPVGYDGETYVQDLSALNEVDAELPNGHRCSASFYYLPVKGAIPTIGPLRCRNSQLDDTDLAGNRADASHPTPSYVSEVPSATTSSTSSTSEQR